MSDFLQPVTPGWDNLYIKGSYCVVYIRYVRRLFSMELGSPLLGSPSLFLLYSKYVIWYYNLYAVLR
jgi:hypothetical protein